jgi:hypothetical protein
MYELDQKYFPLGIENPFPLINSVINKSQSGFIFTSRYNSDLFFIYHKSGFSYLSKIKNIDFTNVLEYLIGCKRTAQYFHIYDAAPGLISSCEGCSAINYKLRQRVKLIFQNNELGKVRNLPFGYSIDRITDSNFDKFDIFNINLQSKFWSSKDDFLENGFGFAVFNEKNLPISVCYSACVANGIVEIDIATLPQNQKLGLASTLVTHFLEYCNAKKLVANWDCFDTNLGSLRTAQNSGFTPVTVYNFLSIFKKEQSTYEAK